MLAMPRALPSTLRRNRTVLSLGSVLLCRARRRAHARGICRRACRSRQVVDLRAGTGTFTHESESTQRHAAHRKRSIGTSGSARAPGRAGSPAAVGEGEGRRCGERERAVRLRQAHEDCANDLRWHAPHDMLPPTTSGPSSTGFTGTPGRSRWCADALPPCAAAALDKARP